MKLKTSNSNIYAAKNMLDAITRAEYFYLLTNRNYQKHKERLYSIMSKKSLAQMSLNKSCTTDCINGGIKLSSQEAQRQLDVFMENASLIKRLTAIHNRQSKPRVKSVLQGLRVVGNI